MKSPWNPIESPWNNNEHPCFQCLTLTIIFSVAAVGSPRTFPSAPLCAFAPLGPSSSSLAFRQYVRVVTAVSSYHTSCYSHCWFASNLSSLRFCSHCWYPLNLPSLTCIVSAKEILKHCPYETRWSRCSHLCSYTIRPHVASNHRPFSTPSETLVVLDHDPKPRLKIHTVWTHQPVCFGPCSATLHQDFTNLRPLLNILSLKLFIGWCNAKKFCAQNQIGELYPMSAPHGPNKFPSHPH